MRLSPVSAVVGNLLDFSASEPLYPVAGDLSASSPIQLGTYLEAAPTDGVILTASVPNWGLCEVVYVRNDSVALVPGTLVHLDKNFSITAVPVTANTGRQVYVTLTNFAVGSTIAQGGWALRAGICPVLYATAATGPLGISGATAGNAAANSAGRQLLNATTMIASTGAFTRTITTRNLSRQIIVSSAAGMFVGQAVSGTGVAASSTIASIDPSGTLVTLNNACTAGATVTGTFTHTGYGIVHLSRAFVQGAIT